MSVSTRHALSDRLRPSAVAHVREAPEPTLGEAGMATLWWWKTNGEREVNKPIEGDRA